MNVEFKDQEGGQQYSNVEGEKKMAALEKNASVKLKEQEVRQHLSKFDDQGSGGHGLRQLGRRSAYDTTNLDQAVVGVQVGGRVVVEPLKLSHAEFDVETILRAVGTMNGSYVSCLMRTRRCQCVLEEEWGGRREELLDDDDADDEGALPSPNSESHPTA
jgi:hypothetical protein